MLRIRREEFGSVFISAMMMIVLGLAFTTGWIVLFTVLLKELRLAFLPYTYFAISAINIFFSSFFVMIADRVRLEKQLIFTSIFCAVCIFLAKFFINTSTTQFSWNNIVYFLLLILGYTLTYSVLSIQVWSIINHLFRPIQAHKFNPLLTLIWIFGGLLSSLIVPFTISSFGLKGLLYVWSGEVLMLVPIALVFGKFFSHKMRWKSFKKEAKLSQLSYFENVKEGCKYVMQSRLTLVIGLIFFFYYVVNGFQELQYLQIINSVFQNEVELGHFYSIYFVFRNCAVIIIQVLVAERFVRWLGVFRSFFVVPVLTAVGFVLLLWNFGFWEAVWLRFSWEISSIAIHTSARQLSLNAIPFSIRGKIRIFYEGVANSAGMILGGLAILFFQNLVDQKKITISEQHTLISALSLFICLIWIVIVAKGRGFFIKNLIKNLKSKEPETVHDAIQMLEERREVLAYQTLVAQLQEKIKEDNIPLSGQIMESLARLGDIHGLRYLSLYLQDSNPSLRSHAIFAISQFKNLKKHAAAAYYFNDRIKKIFKEDSHWQVRIEAGRYLMHHYSQKETLEFIRNLLQSTDAHERLLGIQSVEKIKIELVDLLVIPHLEDADSTVKGEAIRTLWSLEEYRAQTSRSLEHMLISSQEDLKEGLKVAAILADARDYFVFIEPHLGNSNLLIRSLASIALLANIKSEEESLKAQALAVLKKTLLNPLFSLSEREYLVTMIVQLKDETIDFFFEIFFDLDLSQKEIAMRGFHNFFTLYQKKFNT